MADLLYIDDEPLVCRAVQRSLNRHGLSVVTAVDREAALAAVTAQSFDFIISDFRLKVGTGLELLRELGPLQPAALLGLASGAVDPQAIAAELREANVSLFIPKPWAAEQVADLLRRMKAERG